MNVSYALGNLSSNLHLENFSVFTFRLVFLCSRWFSVCFSSQFDYFCLRQYLLPTTYSIVCCIRVLRAPVECDVWLHVTSYAKMELKIKLRYVTLLHPFHGS
jgi:hypothetical protein